MRRKAKFHRPLSHNGSGNSNSHPVTEETDEESGHHIRGEPLKTLIAGIFLVFAWVATTTSLALTHERLPNVTSLPDLTLDNVKKQPWGLDASEIILMICTWMAFLVSIFHQHRYSQKSFVHHLATLGQKPAFYPEITKNLMFEKCGFCEKGVLKM